MLRDSVASVVVRRRPRAIALAISIHWFPFLPHMSMGFRSGCRSFAIPLTANVAPKNTVFNRLIRFLAAMMLNGPKFC